MRDLAYLAVGASTLVAVMLIAFTLLNWLS